MRPQLEDEWNAALADARINDTEAKLFEFPPGADLGGGRQAVYQSPRQYLLPDPARAFMEVLNADVDLHRVGIAANLEPHIAAGVIRHELEHARQYERFGAGVFRIQDLIGLACWEKTGSVAVGGGFLVNVIPPELDANAAAARFAWSRHATTLDAYMAAPDAGHQVLFRYERGPESLDTLLWRTLAYAATLADLCETTSLQRTGMPFRVFAEEATAGSGVLWDRLRPQSGGA
jgi:hypothetical protein